MISVKFMLSPGIEPMIIEGKHHYGQCIGPQVLGHVSASLALYVMFFKFLRGVIFKIQPLKEPVNF